MYRHAKPLYLNPKRCRSIRLRDGQVRIQPTQGKARDIPLSDISQIILSEVDNGLLGLLTTMAHNHRAVFITNGHGRPIARLVGEHEHQRVLPFIADIIDTLRHRDFHGYHEWLEAQKAHSCSRILRGCGQRQGDYHHCLRVIHRACRLRNGRNALELHLRHLRTQLDATVVGYIHKTNLHALVHALHEHGLDLASDLGDILWPAVLRNYHQHLSHRKHLDHRAIVAYWASVQDDVTQRMRQHLSALPQWVHCREDRPPPTAAWLRLHEEPLDIDAEPLS